jgi:hypothetical protein
VFEHQNNTLFFFSSKLSPSLVFFCFLLFKGSCFGVLTPEAFRTRVFWAWACRALFFFC